jgi:hypothetical protein
MSIETTISVHVARKHLHIYEPAYAELGFQHVRRILMTTEAYQTCPPKGVPTSGNLKGMRLGATRDLLAAFVGGEPIEEEFQLKHLKPTDLNIFELRVTQPKDRQVRLIGWILIKDTFVGVKVLDRDGLDFEKAIERTKEKREQLFNGATLCGVHFADYITNGVSINE